MYRKEMKKGKNITKLQEIRLDVPEAARKICREILDHTGIFRYKSAKGHGFVFGVFETFA